MLVLFALAYFIQHNALKVQACHILWNCLLFKGQIVIQCMHTPHGLPSFLCMWISSFNKSICWRDCPFPVEYPWHPCSKKSIDYIHKGFFLNLFSIPLVYISVFRPEPHCSDDCTFVVNFEIRKCESSKFFRLFQDSSGYLGVLESPYDSYNVFDYIWKKKCHWGFDRYLLNL